MSFNKLMLISTTLILMVGCKRATSDDTKATLHLALPAAFQVSQKNWGISEPADFSGYNCYGVFVEAPEDPKNTCKNTAGVTVASPTEWFGGFWAGGGSSNIVDIPVTTGAGQKRKISVVGLKTIDQATCEKLHDAVADSSMSPPAILGSSTIDLNPGETKDLRIDVSYNSRIVMDDCTGPDFNHNDDGSPTTTTTTSTTTTTLLTNAVLSSSSPSLANLTAIPYDDQTTHTVTYTITNTGTETATAMSVSVSGNPNYTINGNTCASTLGINGTCTFNLNFIAPPPGSYPFTITVGFTDSTGSHSYPIANTGSSVMAVQPLYGGRDRWND